MASWTARWSARIRVPQALKKGTADEQALGRSRGGFSTKIHVLVDGLGNPLRVRLTPGQAHDSPHAAALLDGLAFERVIADRSDAGQPVIKVVARGAEVVIPPHPRTNAQREDDRWWYRERHLVECSFNKRKHFRRFFSQFDKLTRRYLGFIQFRSVLIWLH